MASSSAAVKGIVGGFAGVCANAVAMQYRAAAAMRCGFFMSSGGERD
jgi:hypothetical protein